MSSQLRTVPVADLLTPCDVEIGVTRTTPRSAGAVGVAVGTDGAVSRSIGLGRSGLTERGFSGSVGQTLVVPRADGPDVVAVGIGPTEEVDATALRNAAAAFARVAAKRSSIATNLADADGVDPGVAAQAVVEGVLLAAYRFVGLKRDASSASPLRTLTLTVPAASADAVRVGADRGLVTARSTRLARDLANLPPAHLTARRMATLAVELAGAHGLEVEVFDRDQLDAMGCGGIVGVNRGSDEPPRLVKLTYRPTSPTGHLVLVGKGVMYDSGGISIKPSDAFHQVMKMDMSGAAAVLATMAALADLEGTATVTGYLVCTDNMPSGTAMKLGDVLTMRNGTTVEIHNTDAEGRLILADGLSLAVEDGPDAIVDIATLTGAALGALGTQVAPVLGTDQALVDRLRAGADRTDEPIWQLPLDRDHYRKLLDSVVADLKNIGGPYAGTITASIFLSEFVGEVPWAHLDIAGPMKTDSDEGWWAKGATGFGTRLLIDLATCFTPPGSD